MGHADYLKVGDFNTICDECGKKFKGSKLLETWDGLRMCRKCWQPRHPQDYVKGVKDDTSTPYTRPEPPDNFTS